MKRHLAFIALLLSAPAFGAAISDVYVIPAAAHTTGAGGETWQSDISFFNPSSTPLTLDLALVDANGNATTLASAVAVAPRATLFMRDVVGTSGGSGAIIVSGNHPLVIMSRATASSSRGTFVESVLPAAEFIAATSHDSFLTGLTSNATSRTNVGFFAAADRGAPMTVTITLFAADGTQLGTPQTFTIPAGATIQRLISTRSLTTTSFDNASAQVSITGGSGIATAYASVIANDTGSAAFIAGSTGSMPPSSAAAALRAHLGW